ncbi:MAG: MBL fold metallo-hydrolase [Patescibacteria group bacterium]|nr:MBL fold metallo-hydrolase [Patescibacteria group bacterium]
MKIKWFGQACFQIESKDAIIVTDPYGEKIGIKLPELRADLITVSHQHFDHNNTGAIMGISKIISSAGNFDYKNIKIVGIESFHDDEGGVKRGKNIIFKFLIDGIKITHFGDIGQLALNADQINVLKDSDIVMIPVGGVYTVNAEGAIKILNQINPKVIIPMHYGVDGLSVALNPVKLFIDEFKVKHYQKDILEITGKHLPQNREIVVLNIFKTDSLK